MRPMEPDPRKARRGGRAALPAAAVGKSCGDVTFLTREGAPEEECAFLTAPMDQTALEKALAALGAPCVKMRVLG